MAYSRARILADYVNSGDELALKAPLASPTFTGTVAIPNVANLETAVVANTAKVTNATHTGDVTGSTALTIADDAVTGGKLANDIAISTTGATALTNTLTVGVNDTGHDVIFYGATSGKKMQWDESQDTLALHNSIMENSESGSFRLHPNANATGTCTYAFKDDNDTGMIRTTANELALVTNGDMRLNIDSSGYVGIAQSNPAYLLDIVGPNTAGVQTVVNLSAHTGCGDGPSIRFNAGAGPAAIAGVRVCLGGTAYGSEIRFYNTRWTGSAQSSGNVLTIQHNGDLLSYTGSDSIGTISDKRLKENIEDFSYSLDTFKQLETKIFEWKNPDAHASSGSEIGFLAQDVELIDSRWVSDFFIDNNHPDYDLLQDTHITDIDENENETLLGKTTSTILGRKDVMYISVIQQLLGKVETLETKVTALENA